ncbi:hypothetical protein V3C99_004574 [Haemonchus contortus]|uniref:G_PROTEIN_RECEP_F1_2 domain-containing protein n=1 Tax=Haemonchus contortus TaxID=6289 RepID=A0A7I4XXC1_HAECO|nr:7TM GPCR domain containing protein [Haemonchus contortus]
MGHDEAGILVMVFTVIFCLAQIILALCGIFGHSVILFATYKTKEIQTKYGLLLVQLSVAHIICILGQLVNTAFLVVMPVIGQMLCFRIFFVFMASMFWQSIIVLIISIDLLCAIVIPLLYRKWTVKLCVTMNIVVCCSLAIVDTAIAYGAINAKEKSECNIYSIRAHKVSIYAEVFSYCVAALQVLTYLTCYTIMYIRAKMFTRKNKNACFRNQHRKTMRTISVMVVIYVCTWVLSIVITRFADFVSSSAWRRLLWMIASLLQMLCFIQTFYVCYQRSSEYRNIFRRLHKSIKWLQKVKDIGSTVCHGTEASQAKRVFFITK